MVRNLKGNKFEIGNKNSLLINEYLFRSNSNPTLNMNTDLTSRSLNRAASMRAETNEMSSSSYTGRDGQIRILHEELALQWVVNSLELSMTNSWFLFDMMVKSMIEHLDWTNSMSLPRKNRFSHQFTEDIIMVVQLVINKVVWYNNNSDAKQAQSLNSSLAFFLFDLLSIMDRGFVFGLINSYYKIMISKGGSIPELVHYKLDFLRIVCCHEHFVPLNLPFGTPYTALSAPCSPTPSVTSNHSQNSYISTMVSNSIYTAYFL